MTFRTAAKPSSESPRATRSTVSAATVSALASAPGPKMRRTDAATLAGGAPCLMSELVSHAESQGLTLPRAGRRAQHRVVPLERGVPRGLEGETECRDSPRQSAVPCRARRNIGLGVVTLVTHEGAQVWHEFVCAFEIAAGDAAADCRAVEGI